MEKYRCEVKKRIAILGALIIAAVGIEIFSIITVTSIDHEGAFSDGALEGFPIGLLTGIMVLLIMKVIQYSIAIKNDTKLRKLYNMENDERKRIIKEKSGANVVIFSSIIIIFVAIILGHYSKTIFLTLVGCAFFLLLVSISLKLYYSKKY